MQRERFTVTTRHSQPSIIRPRSGRDAFREDFFEAAEIESGMYWRGHGRSRRRRDGGRKEVVSQTRALHHHGRLAVSVKPFSGSRHRRVRRYRVLLAGLHARVCEGSNDRPPLLVQGGPKGAQVRTCTSRTSRTSSAPQLIGSGATFGEEGTAPFRQPSFASRTRMCS